MPHCVRRLVLCQSPYGPLSNAIAQGLGACLTPANLEDIKRFVEDFAVRALLPAMEARVRALNHQVIHPHGPAGLTQTLHMSDISHPA